MKHMLMIIVIALFAISASIEDVSATRILLYDVDFGTPPHIVGEPPVVGTGDPPRDTPTSIPFGDPTVVEALGLLTDQPCSFGNGTTGYDQLQFTVQADYPGGFDEQYEVYHLEMDVLVEELIGSYFVLLIDAPQVHNIYFNADGTMTSFPAGLDATFGFGVPYCLKVTFDIPRDRWRVWLNGELIHHTNHAGSFMRSFRYNLSGNHVDDSVGIDNVRIYGENLPINHVCCVGEVCYIRDFDDCEAMGGEFHWEWDSCEPVNPCETTPTRKTSWGVIKSTYR